LVCASRIHETGTSLATCLFAPEWVILLCDDPLMSVLQRITGTGAFDFQRLARSTCRTECVPPTCGRSGRTLPSSRILAFAHGDDFAPGRASFSARVVGNDDSACGPCAPHRGAPPTQRSCKGRNFHHDIASLTVFRRRCVSQPRRTGASKTRRFWHICAYSGRL